MSIAVSNQVSNRDGERNGAAYPAGPTLESLSWKNVSGRFVLANPGTISARSKSRSVRWLAELMTHNPIPPSLAPRHVISK